MVGTIIPMVHGNGSRKAYHWLILHLGATTAGAMLAGAVIGWSGQIVRALHGEAVAMVALGGVQVALALRELEIVSFPVPQHVWQVPRVWQARMSRGAAVMAYGAVIGAGVFTRIRSGAFYAIALWAFVLGDPRWGAVLFLAHAAGKALPMLAIAVTTSDRHQLSDMLDRLAHAYPLCAAIIAILLVAAGSAAFFAGATR